RRCSRPPVRQPSRAGDVACAQRVRHRLLLRRRGGGVPAVAAGSSRRPECPERRVGDCVLGSAVPPLGPGVATAGHTLPAQPPPVARLSTVPLRRTAGGLSGTA